MDEVTVDVLIIGAGPVGLYGTYYAGFRGMSVAVMDSLPEVGGQLAALYPEKNIYDVAGFPSVRGQDLVDALLEQAQQSKPTLLLEQRATTIDVHDEGVTIGAVASTPGEPGVTVHAKAVLIAGGMGTFEPKELPAGGDFAGRGLRYFVPRLADLAGHDVVVVGGGDSAVDWALALEPLANSVALVHRRDAFRAHEKSVSALQDSSVEVVTPYEVVAIAGGTAVETVTLEHVDSKETHTRDVKTVVAAIGFLTDLGPMADWGMELKRRRILVDRTQKTNLPRVFAAGDIAQYEGKVALISVGFGEAATAINHIAPLVNTKWKTTPGHSSDSL
ncbi:NAD(P)/FAD-dependent oxidoreductase [Cryptosporangium sp. NPDC051539]|uniref:NAD(P)/FAD-dependent oxidoreductase n=1 Tax=Cryptosporangium sp. NPDC051539 TaxID=3363962 RepID=UPI00379006B7